MIALLLLAVVGLIEAKPSIMGHPTFGNMIIGGTDASPGEFPWQLSQQRGGSHSCGASLLSSTRCLSAAHCVDGAAVGTLDVVAGLHQRSNTAGAQSSAVARYVMHAEYNRPVGGPTFSNDIAIIYVSQAFTTGSNIQFATLPADNSNNYDGTTCVISGWGRTSSSNVLPDTLQKASIGVVGTQRCQTLMAGVNAEVWDGHICLYDEANNIGSCNGDSGGPLNCPPNQGIVAGVTSWGVSSGQGNCLQTYPSVYTRTSYYLAWIGAN